MPVSKRKPAAAPVIVKDAKIPASPARRRAAAVPASKTAAMPEIATAQPIAAKTPQGEKREKRVRASFMLPESQIALLKELKERCLAFGANVKKGELLTAGLQVLRELPETALEAAVLPLMRPERKPAAAKKRKK
jgi:hypothetical protein